MCVKIPIRPQKSYMPHMHTIQNVSQHIEMKPPPMGIHSCHFRTHSALCGFALLFCR